MANINGKVYAINVVTPMKPWKTWLLRGFFFLLGHIASLRSTLINLRFIQFARWVVVPRHSFPYLGRTQEREDLKYDYLFFFSNFNGTWNQYIDAFSAVLSVGLNLVWRWSEKFPGPTPVTPFKNYITALQYDTDYYFSAYPEATLNDVEAAHIVQSEFDRLRNEAAALTPEQFRTAYLRFVLNTQIHLGPTGQAPELF